MLAESNLTIGGEQIIFAALTDSSHAISKQDNTVNDLIAVCSNSKAALEELYIMFKSSVFAIAFSITSDYHLSEDCVMETFFRLTQLKRFSPDKGDGKGIIFTTARNVALEIRRQNKKHHNGSIIIQSYGDAEKTVEDNIFINQILKHLNDKQRQIVVFKCCAEMTFKEIASIMKMPVTTVQYRYKKAMNILKEKAGVNDEKK